MKNTYDVATTVIKNNVKKYIEFIEEARTKGAQIIVFPEDGLTTLDATNLLPEHLLSSSVPTINISALPCTAEDQNSEVSNLLKFSQYFHHAFRSCGTCRVPLKRGYMWL